MISCFQDGLDKAKVMVAFCFDDYGEHTGMGFETYDELGLLAANYRTNGEGEDEFYP